MGGMLPFTLYGFPPPAKLEVVLLEHYTSHAYLEAAEDTAHYDDVFNHLRASALSARKSEELIAGIAGELAT
ncbi:hypothetical protein GL263_09655 [Streptomyces durbertensis]|uniref:DUF5753 domain-containing protein n=2 Tax=Streptomyces durbertensis TaxID=2448886 RepID=A0ABR6EES0_9ACTN|nr:hypothetical protein [Streptomyces durbertensis]